MVYRMSCLYLQRFNRSKDQATLSILLLILQQFCVLLVYILVHILTCQNALCLLVPGGLVQVLRYVTDVRNLQENSGTP